MAVLALLSAGCAAPGRAVYIASDTSLGVAGALNTARTSGRLIIGYDRQFVAVVPKKPASTGPASGNGAAGAGVTAASDTPPVRAGDALSTFNCTHLEIDGITVTKFYERLATGPAAIALIGNLHALQDVDDCTHADRDTANRED